VRGCLAWGHSHKVSLQLCHVSRKKQLANPNLRNNPKTNANSNFIIRYITLRLDSVPHFRVESTRLPPMLPGFDSETRRFLVLSLCSKRFFPGYSGFPLFSKTYIWFELISIYRIPNKCLSARRFDTQIKFLSFRFSKLSFHLIARNPEHKQRKGYQNFRSTSHMARYIHNSAKMTSTGHAFCFHNYCLKCVTIKKKVKIGARKKKVVAKMFICSLLLPSSFLNHGFFHKT